MTWKNSIPFVLALAFGLVAAKVGRDVFIRSAHATVSQTKLVNVVIAHADVEAGAALTQEDIVLGAAPADSTPLSAFKATAELVGRVMTVPLVKGQVIVEPMLAPMGAGAGAQALVPAGMRAVTVEVNEFSGVAGLIAPGSHVDVVSTLSDERTNQPVAKTVVQNVKVIAVGQRLDASSSQGKKADKVEAAPGRSVTLLVTPRQAEILEFVSSSARLRLTLRGSLDSAAVSSKTGVGVADLLDRATEMPDWVAAWLLTQPSPAVAVTPTTRPVDNQAIVANPPVPVKPVVQPRVRTVEVINGGEVSTVQYRQKSPSPGSAITTTQDEQQHIGGNHD